MKTLIEYMYMGKMIHLSMILLIHFVQCSNGGLKYSVTKSVTEYSTFTILWKPISDKGIKYCNIYQQVFICVNVCVKQ
jgi:hypothetical protein